MIPLSDASVRRSGLPIVNVLLISLNTLVFLYELQLGGLGLVAGSSNLQINLFFFRWGFIPDELTHGDRKSVV